MGEYTTLEIAALCQRTERTVQRWLSEHRLKATHIIGNRYEVAEDDLQPFLPHHEVESLSERLSALEARQDALETRLAVLEAMLSEKKPPRTPRAATVPPQTQETPGDIPEGSVLSKPFAERHGVHERTFRDQIDRGDVPANRQPKPGRPRETERWLTEAQQRGAIAFWQDHGTTYEMCDDPECPCHKFL